mgnify:CR=1 FL=1
MSVKNGFIDCIGNTPLIRLNKASDVTGCTILGKAEFLNPGGSVKDDEVIKAANDAGISMVFTGTRHFRH